MTSLEYNDLIQSIETRLHQTLPGIDAQKRMMPKIHDADRKYFSNLSLRKAAVLITLFPYKNSIATLFIERTQDASPHSGQIAFPGGKYEDSDNTQIYTALREAEEEVGIDSKLVKVLGALTPVEIPISGYSVLPVVGYLQNEPKIIASPNEVKSYYKTSIIDLFNPNNKKFGKIQVRNQIITSHYYGLQDTLIWGATAMVLSEFEELMSDLL